MSFVALSLVIAAAQEGAGDERAQGRLAEALAQAQELFAEVESFTDPEALRTAACETIERLIEASDAPPDLGPLVNALKDAAALAYEDAGLPCAQDAYERILGLLEGKVPEDHPFLLDMRCNLAATLGATGNQAAALALYERVLPAYLAHHGPEHAAVLETRMNLAITLRGLGRDREALEHYEDVLAAYRRTRPAGDPDLQLTRMNYSSALIHLAEFDAARAVLEELLAALSPEEREDRIALEAKVNLAAVHCDEGDLAAAESMLAEVLPICEQRFTPEDPCRLQALSFLARVYTEGGRLDEGRAIAQRLLELRLAHLHPDSEQVQVERDRLANVLQRLGDHRGSELLLEQMRASFGRTLPPDHAQLLSVRTSLATTRWALGDAQGADRQLTELWREHGERMKPQDPVRHALLFNLAEIRRALGDVEESRKLLSELLALEEGPYRPGHPMRLSARLALARTLREAGELEPALAETRATAAELVQTLPPDSLVVSEALADLAWLGRVMQEEQGDVLDQLAGALSSSARASSFAPPREVAERLLAREPSLGAFLSLTRGEETTPVLRERAFELVETLRAVATSGASAPTVVPPRAADLERDLAAARNHLNDLVGGAAAGPVDPTAWREELFAAVRRRDDLLRELGEAWRAAGHFARSVDLASLAGALAEEEAAVGFRRYERWVAAAEGRSIESAPHFLAHVVTPGGALVRVELGPLEPIERAVEQWRRRVADPTAEESAIRAAGAALAALVLEPLVPHVSKARRLFVALDDALFWIPLDALPLGDGFVGERFEIVHEVSFQGLLSRAPRPASQGSFVAVGGVDFGAGPASEAAVVQASAWRSGAESFGALARSGEEVRTLASLFESAKLGETRLLTGKEAHEDALAALASEVRFLHLATHGVFYGDAAFDPRAPRTRLSPELSEPLAGLAPLSLAGLALAGANLPPDELGRVRGILTAEELAGVDLARCELAVLSACETNAGERRTGQGIQSLQTALHAAGVRTAVTSLWGVQDDQALRVLFEFYHRVWIEGEPKARALWSAKRAAQAERVPLRHWAGWVLSGSPE